MYKHVEAIQTLGKCIDDCYDIAQLQELEEVLTALTNYMECRRKEIEAEVTKSKLRVKIKTIQSGFRWWPSADDLCSEEET
jgi:hypothetical protein